MQATDFTRDDCLVGNERRTYRTLEREWRCSDCGGRLGTKWSDGDSRYPDDWHVECLACGNDGEFVHEYEIERRRHNAAEALDSLAQSDLLPPELAAALGIQKREPVLFSLCAQEVEI